MTSGFSFDFGGWINQDGCRFGSYLSQFSKYFLVASILVEDFKNSLVFWTSLPEFIELIHGITRAQRSKSHESDGNVSNIKFPLFIGMQKAYLGLSSLSLSRSSRIAHKN